MKSIVVIADGRVLALVEDGGLLIWEVGALGGCFRIYFKDVIDIDGREKRKHDVFSMINSNSGFISLTTAEKYIVQIWE